MPCEPLKPIENYIPNIEVELSLLHDVLKMQNAPDEFLKGFKMCLDHYIELNNAINEINE
jgi:hypothetical protein